MSKKRLMPVSHLLDLTGKVAIVTGAGRGIGQACALRLAEAGASVMVTDIVEKNANNTVELIKAENGKAQAMAADVTKKADAEKTVSATVKAFGGVDILVNNAGIFPFCNPLEIGEEVWDKTLAVNLKGLYFHTQAAAKEMIKAQKGGRIINLSSISSFHPQGAANGYLLHYGSSKAAVSNLTRILSVYLGKHNILVNAIAPGLVVSKSSETDATSTAEYQQVAEEWGMKIMARDPLGRVGKPDDIAKIVLFLSSPVADYVTGQILTVDGGFTLT